MEKPTVFFSHSSSDKAVLSLLKDLVLEKVGSSIEIFLASDGESIPFGKNWVHQIEEALDTSKLMFVFITPHSMRSHWLLFESGYAYSKKIRVVPVGFIGFDICNLTPPLSLLQGFNISSQEGLSNIIATMNKEFNTRFKTEFTKEEHCHPTAA